MGSNARKVFRKSCESFISFGKDVFYPLLGGPFGCSQPPWDVAALEDMLLVFSSPTQAIWSIILVVEAFVVGCKVSVAGPGSEEVSQQTSRQV